MMRPDFPRNLLEFQRRFSTEEACRDFIRDVRWPKGFICPACSHKEAHVRKDTGGFQCRACGKITSVTAGTVMHRTHLPLTAWMWAAWLLVTSKGGISGLELSRQFGIRQESAFTLLHRLRHAMVAPERSRLRGVVEVDETYVGGFERGRIGRGTEKKALVVGAVEVRGKKPTRIRLRLIEDGSYRHIHGFIRDTIEPGSLLVTDGSGAYKDIPGYRHSVKIAGQEGVEQDDVLPYFHTAISNLKAWLKGTHHGAVRRHHLQAYLNEFCFRYNRRENLGEAFMRLLELSPAVGSLPYSELYGEKTPHKNPGRRSHANA